MDGHAVLDGVGGEVVVVLEDLAGEDEAELGDRGRELGGDLLLELHWI